MTENLRSHGAAAYGHARPEFGVLEGPAGQDGTRAVRAACVRTSPYPAVLTALTEQEADALARRPAARHDGTGGTDPDGARAPLTGVSADRHTAEIFAAAWQRITGAEVALARRQRLYRLGELRPPRPLPPGRARAVAEQDRELLARWYEEFRAAVGEPAGRGGHAWAQNRTRLGDVLLRETPQGEPAAMAGRSPQVAGQVRITGVYTPAPLRGRGCAGAVTAELSRAVRASGAREVVLFTDLANPTSNALYQRLGYRPVSGFAQYAFT